MKHLWRLSTVIDCGTINWDRRVLLWFQLSEYDVEPQDTTLPIYKQFAKTPYGWLLTLWTDFCNDMCDWLWLTDVKNEINELISKAWNMYDIEIEMWEYQWKPTYNVVSVSPSDVEDTFEWWVDVKTFIFTDETTLSDINALGFDNKHVKNSDEYNILKQKTLEDETVPF